jgi:hypothetical protein
MRLSKLRLFTLIPAVAVLGLAACGEEQVAQEPDPVPPPAAEAPATETEEAQAPTQDAPAATGDELPRAQSAPPTPSAIFEEGADALGDIDETIHSVFADAPFDAGSFEAEGYRLDIDEEGDFRLEMMDSGRVLHGDLRVYGDMFTMSNITEDTDPGEFPMTCRVVAAPEGFELAADGPSCTLFDGLVFARATQ